METITRQSQFQLSSPCNFNRFSRYPVCVRSSSTRVQPILDLSESSTTSSLEAKPSTLAPQWRYPTESVFSRFDELEKPISMDAVKQIHAQIAKMNREDAVDAWKKLVDMYVNMDDFESVGIIFSHLAAAESLNHLLETIRAAVKPEALFRIVAELHKKGLMARFEDVLAFAVKICGDSGNSLMGGMLHGVMVKTGSTSHDYLDCVFLKMYGRSCKLEEARKVFDKMSSRTTYLWDVMIEMYVKNQLWFEALEFFREMQFSLVQCSRATIARVLQACGRLEALREGKQVHGYAIRYGLLQFVAVGNSLISTYCKTRQLGSARLVFDGISNRDLISWNSMISGYALNDVLNDAWDVFQEMDSSGTKPDVVTWNCLISGHALHGSVEEVEKIFHMMNREGIKPDASSWSSAISGFSRRNDASVSLRLFRKMLSSGTKPNASSITSILQAVAEQGTARLGREIHGHISRNGYENDICMRTSLVEMYVKHGRLVEARRVFDYMKHRNSFTWNTLVAGYARNRHIGEALDLLNQMEEEGIQPDLITWNSLISGYSRMGQSKQALVLIRQLNKTGFTPNVVSWTAMISGCSKAGNYGDALLAFREMQKAGIQPNAATVASLVSVTAALASFHQGAELHCYAIRNGLDDYKYVASALVDMYSRSGSLENAYHVFSKIKDKNLVCWNAMIKGYALHRLGEKAISIYDEMREIGIQPDGVTFTSLLSACSHSGLLVEGWKFFDSMREEFGVIPTIEHYACMIDLLGRNGYLDEALDLIKTMPLRPDTSVWGSLLLACKVHQNVKLAEFVAKRLFKLEPYNSANYSLLMNLYAAQSRWDEIENLKDAMNVIGVRNKRGWSWIWINKEVHVFSAKGRPHRDMGEIYFELCQLVAQMRRLGYKPDTSCVILKADEDQKEQMVLSHSEKLAITYGLIKTGEGMPIRVIANTRICGDCHVAAKYISRITGRKIYLRDGCRFHEFVNGKCSCNDYW
ncbi:Pentatricopeptide repeat-containing protein [Nymphaea thermarum]|nr:Pentatricopeptide repeat-containing protein [Nymphaea thermarum]